jgi:hypothetical protein
MSPQLCLTFGVYANFSHVHGAESGLGKQHDGPDLARVSLYAGGHVDRVADHGELQPAAPADRSDHHRPGADPEATVRTTTPGATPATRQNSAGEVSV